MVSVNPGWLNSPILSGSTPWIHGGTRAFTTTGNRWHGLVPQLRVREGREPKGHTGADYWTRHVAPALAACQEHNLIPELTVVNPART